MIAFDKPVRPEWIHTTYLAWQPRQPIAELIKVIDRAAAPELHGSETRRKVAAIILRCFVKTEGGGPHRLTADRDVFASAATKFSASMLRSVYLYQLISSTPALRGIAAEMARRYDLGDEIRSTDFLHRVYEQEGQRGVVQNCVRHFLRTLSWFGTLDQLAPNHYRFACRLPVAEQTFPLMLCAYFRNDLGSYQIEPSGFISQPSLHFVNTTEMEEHFRKFNNTFWVAEKRASVDRVTMKYTTLEALEEAALHYLRSLSTPSRDGAANPLAQDDTSGHER